MIEQVLIAALASYRVARMLVMEEGPFGWFEGIRKYIQPDPKIPLKTWIERGYSCQLCLGFWLSILFYAGLSIPVVSWVIVALAVAGAQVCLARFFQ